MSDFAPGHYQCPHCKTWYLVPGPVAWDCLLRVADREGWALLIKAGKTYVFGSEVEVAFEERDHADDWKKGIKP